MRRIVLLEVFISTGLYIEAKCTPLLFRRFHHGYKLYMLVNVCIMSHVNLCILFFAAWDLLRICVYGFKNFVADFLEKYPNHFLPKTFFVHFWIKARNLPHSLHVS